jgi:hypothetical protein
LDCLAFTPKTPNTTATNRRKRSAMPVMHDRRLAEMKPCVKGIIPVDMAYFQRVVQPFAFD